MKRAVPEIVQDLPDMSRDQSFHGLQFYNDPSVDNDVCVIFSDRHTLVADLKRNLLFHGYSALAEFVCERVLINGLRETMAEFIQNLERRSDDPLGKLFRALVERIFHPCSSPSIRVSIPAAYCGRYRATRQPRPARVRFRARCAWSSDTDGHGWTRIFRFGRVHSKPRTPIR